MTLFERTKNILIDIFFTPHCIACNKLNPHNDVSGFEFLCGSCYAQIPRAASIICPTCNRRVIFGKRGGSTTHNSCKKKRPFFLLSGSYYENTLVKNIIRHYKYRGISSFSKPLAELILDRLGTLTIPDIESYRIVPVPLHPKKEKARGFNQSLLIAKHIAHELDIPLLENCIIRKKNTKTQAKLKTDTLRSQNIKNSFLVTEKRRVANAHCIIVDDIYTSGATMTEMANTLKQAGVRRVIGMVVARS